MKYCMVFILLLLSPILRAGDGVKAATEGLSHYRRGAYQEALAAFTLARDSGLRDGCLEFNIGNCWWRLDDPARALLHYKRAERWFPRDLAVAANIELCRKQLGLDQGASVPFLRAFVETASAFTLRELSWFTVAGAVWLFLALIMRQFIRGKGTGWFAFASLAIVLLFGGQVAWRHLDKATPALVVVAEVQLRAEPSKDLKSTATLRAGVSLNILRGEGDWCQVETAGRKGWLPANAVCTY